MKIASMPGLMGLFLSMAFLTACVSTDPSKINFPDNSDKALVLLRADSVPVEAFLLVTRFDETRLTLIDSYPFAGNYILALPKGGLGTSQYIGRVIDPGTYAFQNISQQGNWGVCFHNETKSFTVHSGEAVFLGELNALPNLAQLQSLAKANGDSVVRLNGPLHHYYDGIIPPNITSPIEGSVDFARAKDFEAQSMPTLHGRLKPVVYKPARFGTGYSIGGDHICGGYFNENVKDNPR